MERRTLKIFEEFCPHIEPGMVEDIQLFLGIEEGVSKCQVDVAGNGKILVNIILEKFSYALAKNVFLHLAEFMRHSYYNVFVCEEMEERVRYQFLTGLSGKDGVGMEVTIV